jgi:hypothetical protein
VNAGGLRVGSAKRCEGSELIWQYSSPWLSVGLPVCCPRCGAQVTLVAAPGPDKGPYVVPMSPRHDREIAQGAEDA